MTSPSSLVARSPGWGRSDFGVTHWRKLLSRRSTEQDDETTKSSEHHMAEHGSCDRRPNLVVRRVVTHGFPLSVKKAALQWKVRRSNRVKSTRRNVLRAPRVRRLLSDRFSEICGNVSFESSDVVVKDVLPETGGKSVRTRVKAACFQNDEILERLSHLWRGTQPCHQGALMETEEQGARSGPVDTRCASVSSESTDGEMVADSMGSLSPAKKRKTSRDAGNMEGDVWQSHVVEGNSLKVNFKRISSPTSDTSIACSPSECRDVESCSVEVCASSEGSVLVEQSSDRHDSDNVCHDTTTIRQCFVDLGSRVTAGSCTHAGEREGCGRTYNTECADVQQNTPTQSNISANVMYVTAVPIPSGDNNVDVKGVTVALSARRDIVTDVRNVTKAPLAGSDNSTGVNSVTRGPSTDSSDNSTDVKSVTRGPSTDSSDNSTDVKSVTRGPSTDSSDNSTDVKSVTRGPSTDSSDNSTDVKSVTRGPSTDSSDNSTDVKSVTRGPSTDSSDNSTDVKNVTRGPSIDSSDNSTDVKSVTRGPSTDSSDNSTDVKSVTRGPSTDSSDNSTDVKNVIRGPSTGSDNSTYVKSVIRGPSTGSDNSTDVKSVTRGPSTGSDNSTDVKSVTRGPSTDSSDNSTDVKNVIRGPSTGSDNSTDVKSVIRGPSTGSDNSTDVKNVTRGPSTGSDNSTDVKSVIRGPSTGHRSITKVTAGEGHTSIEKLAALMTLESYWRVAEALGMAKKPKTHHRQKTSAKNSAKSPNSKIPWKQTKWSDDSGASHRKNTSRNGGSKTKHRTKHGKMPSDPVRLSSKRGVMHAGRWLSLASVVQTSRGSSPVTSPMKRCVSAEEDRSNCVHLSDKVGGGTHQADMEVTWSTSKEPVFSTRQQPALLKGVKSVRLGVAHTADRPKVGRSKTKVSGMEAVASGKERNRHVSRVKLPETEVNVSVPGLGAFGKETHRNEKKATDAKCKEQKQDVQPRLPEKVRELDTERTDPRTARKLSALWMQQPEKEVKCSRAEAKVPGIKVTQGRTEVKLPGTEDRLSKTAVKPIKKVTRSPSTILSAAYYTDICQPGWGTMDNAEGVTQGGHVKPPESTHVPVRPDGKTHSGGVLRATRCQPGSRVTTDRQKSTVVKSLFHGTCNDKCVNVRHDTTVSDISSNVKDVTRSKPLALSSVVNCDTKVGVTHGDIQKAVSAEAECVTSADANDRHASIKEVVELMTPDSYWSMAEAINTAQKTHSNLDKLTGSHFQSTSSKRSNCSKSAEMVTVAVTEEKAFGKKLKQHENKMKVCESRKWKAFGNEVRLDTQLKLPESGVKLIDDEGKPVVQLKLPANKMKVIDIKLKVLDNGMMQSTPIKVPENIIVSDMTCEETGTVKLPVVAVKLPGMEMKVSGTKVKLLGTDVKLPRTEVKQSCNARCATYHTGICQPFSATSGDNFSRQVVSVNCVPLSQPCCDNPKKNGHKTNEVVDVDANMSQSTDLHKLSHRGPSVGTVTSCDVTQGLHKQLSPVSRVIEACHVKLSMSAHVPVTAPLPSVTDVKNGDSMLKKGCGETETRSMSVSEWRERKALSRQGKTQGRVEDTVGTGEQTQKPSGAVKFHGRTLLFGPEVPVRFIPFHPLYLFHPVRKSGKREVIPTDPRPAHYAGKQLTSEKPTAPLRVTLYRLGVAPW